MKHRESLRQSSWISLYICEFKEDSLYRSTNALGMKFYIAGSIHCTVSPVIQLTPVTLKMDWVPRGISEQLGSRALG